MAHPFPGTHTYGPTYELVLGMMHETGFPTLLLLLSELNWLLEVMH